MKPKKTLEKKSKKGFRGFPLATIAFYGPSNKLATKIALGIQINNDVEFEMIRWTSESDIRYNDLVLREILNCIKENDVKSVLAMDKIIGCPHEEGLDYPKDQACPQCPFWADKDRWSE